MITLTMLDYITHIVDFCHILVLFSHPKSIMSPTLPSQKSWFCTKHCNFPPLSSSFPPQNFVNFCHINVLVLHHIPYLAFSKIMILNETLQCTRRLYNVQQNIQLYMVDQQHTHVCIHCTCMYFSTSICSFNFERLQFARPCPTLVQRTSEDNKLLINVTSLIYLQYQPQTVYVIQNNNNKNQIISLTPRVVWSWSPHMAMVVI